MHHLFTSKRFFISATTLLCLTGYLLSPNGKIWLSGCIKAHFSPESIVINTGDQPILLIIDAYPGHYLGNGVHTVVELPAYTAATDIGITDPEGILIPTHAFSDSSGVIHAKPNSYTLKTPAGSHVTVSGYTTDTLVFEHHHRGLLGRLLALMGILPKNHQSTHFSDGTYKRPKQNSPYREAYDTLAHQLSQAQP